MSKQKRFLGGALHRGIGNAIRESASHAESINVEMLALDRIELDPDNPRKLGLSIEMVRNTDTIPPHLIEPFEKLKSLADSMHRVGVQQPIKVYRHGNAFRVAFGERRFLAGILAGLQSLPAWILTERPLFLRGIQYVENNQREDLTPHERLSNVKAVLDEYVHHSGEKATATLLSSLTGMNRTQSSIYMGILNGPDFVRDALRAGELGSLDKAYMVCRIEDDEIQQTILKYLKGGGSLESAEQKLKALEDARTSDPQEKKRGRPATRIHMGSTTKPDVIRRIMTLILGSDATLQEVDWTDYSAVSKRWRSFLRYMERGKERA